MKKTLRKSIFIALLCFFIGSLTPAHAQNVTWTSSHPSIVSIDANGTIEMVSEPAVTTNVTITQTSTHNDKTVTSTRIVRAERCDYCFHSNHDSRLYCGVKYAGSCWLDRNLGASRVAISMTDTYSYGIFFKPSQQFGQCPDGWSLPNYYQWQNVYRLALNDPLLDIATRDGSYVSQYLYNTPLKIPAAGVNVDHANNATTTSHHWTDVFGDFVSAYTYPTPGVMIYRAGAIHEETNRLNIRCVKDQ